MGFHAAGLPASIILLSIDTCGSLGGVGLGLTSIPERQLNHSRLSGSEDPNSFGLGHPAFDGLFYRQLAGKTFSERLIATVSELLGEAGIELPRLSAIVVVHGPGSFTGIRIGVSAAKGLGEALSIPVIAVSRLELLARQTPKSDAFAVLDAGRGEFFVGIYRGGVREAELLATRDSLMALAGEAGMPLMVCEERIFWGLREIGAELVAAPTAVDALAVGIERFRAGLFDDVATLDANYLRRSETEMLARIAEHAAIKAADAVRG
jgi:tRNA threonylcarbamoyladenosine biosynthesis protein TsaB